MKKLESSFLNMVVVLTLVAVVMGGILAFVNNMTEPPIAKQAKQALADGIKSVMGGGDVVVAQTDTIRKQDAKGKKYTYIIYKAKDKQGKALGAAVESTTMGFGGDLKVLTGFDEQGQILGYTILEHNETPGLGAKVDKWFQQDGKGSNIIGMRPVSDSGFALSKDGGKVNAITASTITSRAFFRAVSNAYCAYLGLPIDGQLDEQQRSKP